MPDPDELFAILNALYWAALALVLGLAIVGAFYWIGQKRASEALAAFRGSVRDGRLRVHA